MGRQQHNSVRALNHQHKEEVKNENKNRILFSTRLLSIVYNMFQVALESRYDVTQIFSLLVPEA